MKKLIWLLICILIVSLTFMGIGCKAKAVETTAAETTVASTTIAETTAAETTVAKPEIEYKPSKWVPEVDIPMVGEKKIAIVGTYLIEALYWIGGARELENLGWKFYFQQCDGDLATEISQIDNVIAKGGWDAVFVNAIDSGGIVDSITKLNEAGYPVFCYDRFPDGGKIEFVSSADHGGTSTQATEHLVQLLTEKNGAPKGKVIALETLLEVDTHRVRVDAMKEVFKKYPDIEVVEKLYQPNADDSIAVLQNALLAEKNVDAIWTQVDWFTQNWEKGLKEIDKWYPVGDPKHIIIQSQDGWDFVLKWIKDGYFDSTYSHRLDLWGYWAVWAAAKYFAGEDLKQLDGFKLDSPPLLIELKRDVPYSSVGSTLVTKDNTDDPRLWGNMMDQYNEVTAILEKGGTTQ